MIRVASQTCDIVTSIGVRSVTRSPRVTHPLPSHIRPHHPLMKDFTNLNWCRMQESRSHSIGCSDLRQSNSWSIRADVTLTIATIFQRCVRPLEYSGHSDPSLHYELHHYTMSSPHVTLVTATQQPGHPHQPQDSRGHQSHKRLWGSGPSLGTNCRRGCSVFIAGALQRQIC